MHATEQGHSQVVTKDASPEAGSAVNCRGNVRKTFDVVFNLAQSKEGLLALTQAFSTCSPLEAGQGKDLGYWIQVA